MSNSMSDKTFTLGNISENQLRVINEALNLYSRLLCGQLEELEFFFRINLEPGTIKDLSNIIQELKTEVFPKLPKRSSYSILSAQIPPVSQIAYDIICVIRNGLAWYNNPNGGYTIDFDAPLKVSSESLMSFTVDNKKE